jgi:thiol-disulfide isomerase/thioredoxin
MSSGARRAVMAVVALVGLQGGALLIYRAVERSRAPVAQAFTHEKLSGRETAMPLEVERDGVSSTVPAREGKVVLVHFWATWCPPCREELPGLLALADELRASGRFELHAISVDDDWSTIEKYFDGVVPGTVVRSRDPAAHKRYGVSTLPDTYLVGTDGRLIQRFGSSRDWTTAEARQHLLAALAR